MSYQADPIALETDACQNECVRVRPTGEDSADFKSRLLYLLKESGRTGGWVEKTEQAKAAREKRKSRLSNGEVWKMLNLPERGQRPGLPKCEAIGEALGASEFWLWAGRSADGRVWLDDPLPGTEQITEQIQGIVQKAVKDEFDRRQTPNPETKGGGQIRPFPGHKRPGR